MIITRSPLRISLGGGGTDLPSYYRDHTGFVIAAALDKYVYITLHEPFEENIIVKYSRLEVAKTAAEVQASDRAGVFEAGGHVNSHVEITSLSDIPAGTGLGSSGSFTTALLRALHIFKKNFVSPRDLAEQACQIEIDLLGEPIGKQDQYIAAFGGITCFTFQTGRPCGRPARYRFRRKRAQPGGQPGAFLHRLHAQRVGILKDQDSAAGRTIRR